MSDIGGAFSEMEELLAVMKADGEDQLATRNSKMEMDYKREKEMQRLRAVIRGFATG